MPAAPRIARPFLDTYREERFFCAILLHALLSCTATQQRLLLLIHQLFGGIEGEDVG